MITSHNLNYEVMNQWTQSYRILTEAIKSQQSKITVYGHDIKVTDLVSYKSIVYEHDKYDIVLDALARALIGHQKVDSWYQ